MSDEIKSSQSSSNWAGQTPVSHEQNITIEITQKVDLNDIPLNLSIIKVILYTLQHSQNPEKVVQNVANGAGSPPPQLW